MFPYQTPSCQTSSCVWETHQLWNVCSRSSKLTVSHPAYLEQEAQKGPQVFFPPWQQAGYPPKHSPMPSTNEANCTATMRAITEIHFVMSIHMFQSLKKSSCFWSIDLCLHKTWEMLSCGLALPLRIVSSVADLMQPEVWTFIVAAFFSGGQFAFLQEEMSPALLSVGTDLFYGSFAFPMRQFCKRRQSGTIWIYLSLLTSSWVGGGFENL